VARDASGGARALSLFVAKEERILSLNCVQLIHVRLKLVRVTILVKRDIQEGR